MHRWTRARTSYGWTGCLLILVGVCVLVCGVHARLRQYQSPAASLAASLMVMEQDERGGVVVTEGERFRAPLENVIACWSCSLLESGSAGMVIPARMRTGEAAMLPVPPILFELFMRPPPTSPSSRGFSAA